VDTCVLLAQNTREQQHQLQGLTLSSRSQISAIKPEDMMNMTNLNEESWIVLRPEEQSIKEKIESLGTPLKNWNIEINYGIKTGYNPAFIIDRATKERLVNEDPKSAKIIRPILRGKDINRYKANFEDLWLIFIPWHFPFHNDPKVKGASEKAEDQFRKNYTAIYNYLLKHKNRLSQRNKAEVGKRYEWYALQRCAASYLKEFDKEKIVWKALSKTPAFSFLPSKIFGNDKVNLLTNKGNISQLKFLLGYFNSTLFLWQFSKIGVEMGEGYEFKIQYIKLVDVVQPSDFIEKIFEELVDKILEKKKNNQNVTYEEQQIDLMVYKLYELTYDEVLVIDPNPPFRREDFEQAQIEAI
jgi:hypothetical protein